MPVGNGLPYTANIYGNTHIFTQQHLYKLYRDESVVVGSYFNESTTGLQKGTWLLPLVLSPNTKISAWYGSANKDCDGWSNAGTTVTTLSSLPVSGQILTLSGTNSKTDTAFNECNATHPLICVQQT